MSRLDIKIKAGTKIIVDYGGGMTVTHEMITDTDIDYLYDTLGRLERVAERKTKCPTCSGTTRETVGMVCQTCGTDYGADAQVDRE